MKKYKYILIFFLSIIFWTQESLFSGDVQKIAEIDLSKKSELKKYNISVYKIFTNNNKLIKEIKGLYLDQVIRKYFPQINGIELDSLEFIISTKSGNIITLNYNEISEKKAKIPAIIGFLEAQKFRDSIEMSGFEGTELSDKQKEKFDDIFTNFQVFKIKTLMKSLPKDTMKMIFKNNFIIFPMDNNFGRWTGDIEKIEIYKP